jgi:coenzyme F420-reducing hydrogenase delta subunit
MSAAMAGKFVEVTKEMTGQIAEMGANPLKGSKSVTE